jgi:hypothetical protein
MDNTTVHLNRYRSEHFILWENAENKRVIAIDVRDKRTTLHDDIDTALGECGIGWGDIVNSRMA